MATKINDQTQEANPDQNALIPIANPDGGGGFLGRASSIYNAIKSVFGVDGIDWVNAGKTSIIDNGFFMQRDVVGLGETVTIPIDHQLIVAAPLTNNGTIVINGRLVIL